MCVSWSSGKDSAWTLLELQRRSDVELVCLLTTLNEKYDRVAMHAVRRSLLRQQAEALRLPLVEVDLPWPCPNGSYEQLMLHATSGLANQGVTHIAFGDLFLEDVRAYRERNLAGTGIEPLFPLFGRDTRALARQMVEAGIVAHLTCVDPKRLDPSFVGRRFDHHLLDALPDGVDPCGENGEFHTLVSGGPMFKAPLLVELGSTLERDGFWFADVLLAPSS